MNSHPSPSSRSATPTPSGLTAPTRTGKIARLPAAIRDHLNTRLHDGESAASLLPWLNNLPEVQAVLATQFNARPVTRQNLSEWRCGGFADWLSLQESRAWLTHLREESAAFSQDSGGDISVSALLAAPLAVVLGRCFQQLAATASTKPAHLHRLLDLAAAVNRLRRSDHAESRLRLEHLRSQSDLALADHRLLVEREHWKTEQIQAEIAAREKIESDKIKAQEDKIHRVRVAQRRARFYGADNPYAAMDAAVLAEAALSTPPPAESPQTASSPSFADKEAALERLNALLARCAASAPTVEASLPDSTAPAHPSSTTVGASLAMAHPSPASVGPSLPDNPAPAPAPSPELPTENRKPPTVNSSTSSSPLPPSHPVAPNPTESNQQTFPNHPSSGRLPVASLPEPASSSPSCSSAD